MMAFSKGPKARSTAFGAHIEDINNQMIGLSGPRLGSQRRQQKWWQWWRGREKRASVAVTLVQARCAHHNMNSIGILPQGGKGKKEKGDERQEEEIEEGKKDKPTGPVATLGFKSHHLWRIPHKGWNSGLALAVPLGYIPNSVIISSAQNFRSRILLGHSSHAVKPPSLNLNLLCPGTHEAEYE
ncbi:hypothetical protein H920_19347 [Fukomys damarensis]|uniref:Uncharacterized protein n=1 Tax=Fukomys damarensis TaxID=885580 RepID=A0A091CKS3_FUKDA|nr:hypothetical protein H920_19347 [Fukomys damarensis]